MNKIHIVGGGLAGCEAAWQISKRGIPVVLYEMRPVRTTAAHLTDSLGELVCSNSLRSDKETTAVGTLKRELRLLDSIILRCAEETRIPAGGALGVDRKRFAEAVTSFISNQPNIEVVREEITKLPDGETIIASGPLTSPTLTKELFELFGTDHLNFYDGISPIVDAETLTPGSFFEADRYDSQEENGDYLNVVMSQSEYKMLIHDLVSADVKPHLEEEKEPNFFDGCLPIEEMARRGVDTPRFGPLKPVGLIDPKTGMEPYAVLQLRKEDLTGKLYNLVGFQTQLSIPDQKAVLKKIPAFENAVFVRYGSAHRNTYIESPKLLNPDLTCVNRSNIRIAGQLAGVEGYVESTACGLMAGLFVSVPGIEPPPATTVIGGLIKYITQTETKDFQPMKANWGVVSELEKRIRKKRIKKEKLADRSSTAIKEYVQTFLQ
ncbi:MAG: methylenetetrahydrofolate--tRNA-(uracil(54)-C(5))-methyltransferase (FADH(2)-oxidizing) TrmFO [Candidatus Lindowbacteria bacterium]|nr:methylenetetrahydrofolate--tRNA-(uracil(54)-C(5))-methyltransferase (FADH(2)-oxidizing) TrmFO [Candidatus Lindowbacteria bacterium]